MGYEYMCANGNCTETDTPIVLSDKGRGLREHFCSYNCVGQWAAKRIERWESEEDGVNGERKQVAAL